MPSAPRFFCPTPLESGLRLELPATAARHAQVLRLQPGAAITLFGHRDPSTSGGEFTATITAMGRQNVEVVVGVHDPVEREAARRLHLAIGIPANERMDWLVEKATELGAASIQPLTTERSVVRLDAQRSLKKLAHWRSIAIAASEQCGRNQVATIHGPTTLTHWLRQAPVPRTATDAALILSLHPDACPLPRWRSGPGAATRTVVFLCGPEGGLSAAEEAQAIAAGFCAVSLGERTLRSETAALAALTLLA